MRGHPSVRCTSRVKIMQPIGACIDTQRAVTLPKEPPRTPPPPAGPGCYWRRSGCGGECSGPAPTSEGPPQTAPCLGDKHRDSGSGTSPQRSLILVQRSASKLGSGKHYIKMHWTWDKGCKYSSGQEQRTHNVHTVNTRGVCMDQYP